MAAYLADIGLNNTEHHSLVSTTFFAFQNHIFENEKCRRGIKNISELQT
ncbi:hypothetical protein Pan241w_50790 [Gimesia alba]|uniref:Uncharacterized protein n=1 Tax=Gimesia alba TaxID=2527973 RepID=A0A517RMD4_9PLAN|nr:hypothetical protein Pan241w_50790 [Gimesia alba]